MHFTRYFALGDSISMDVYPVADLAQRLGMDPPQGVGAASLVFRNDDTLWPEFANQDLVTWYPGIEKVDLTIDGATTTTVLSTQLSHLARFSAAPSLVTLTVGGNDLLQLVDWPTADGDRELKRIVANLGRIMLRIRESLPTATLIVGTVYDPTDGTADLGDGKIRRREFDWLQSYNEAVRGLCLADRTLLADIHRRFDAHGLREPDAAARWYWQTSIIEPNARGASEVRRLWLECIGE